MLNTHKKPHKEFFQIGLQAANEQESSWRVVQDTNGMIEEQILADNLNSLNKTGSRTRIARWKPGALISTPVIHDFHEEVFIAQGELTVGCDSQGMNCSSFDLI